MAVDQTSIWICGTIEGIYQNKYQCNQLLQF
jgi:hypothetical protein